ncbi:MAG: MarR family winged helix-turn-helix transcriptional regulator [Streptosporangiaceae bacterium]|jgi:DNA-binding MarR family transcriptional regulator
MGSSKLGRYERSERAWRQARPDTGRLAGPAAGMTRRDPAASLAVESACCDALSEDLGWALGVVFRSYLKAARAAFADVPGGARGYQVLAAAARATPGSQLELAQHLGVDRTVMTYLLDDLEGSGLIERRPDPADRRARHVLATSAGRALLERLGRHLQAADQHVLAGLRSEEDRQAFRAMLRRLAISADACDPGGTGCDLGRPADADGCAGS